MTRASFSIMITITTALLLVSGLLDPSTAYGMSAAATAIHLETDRGDERERVYSTDIAARPNVETHEGPGGWTTVSRRDGRGRTSVVEHQRSGVAPLESFTAVTSRALRDVHDAAGRFRTADDSDAPHRLAGIDIRRADALPGAAPLVRLAYTRDFAAAGQAAPWLTVRRSDNGAAEVVSRYFVDAQLRLTRSEEDAVTRSYTWHADGRRALETVSAPGVEHSMRHHYDPFGQLDGLSRWTGADEPALPTVDVTSDGAGQITDYTDLETGLSRHLVWDAEGHLSAQVVTPSGGAAQASAYRYNVRDQRIARAVVGAPVAPTKYLWGADGLLRESTEGVAGASTDYLHGNGMVLTAGDVRLAHDHLGSPIVSLTAAGAESAGTFDGWGRYFSGPAPNAGDGGAPATHVGYTGHAYDADSDLTYAEARWYDPDIGAFLSADPVTGGLYEPGTLERFGYVTGNPLLFVDPDGRFLDALFPVDPSEAILDHLVSGGGDIDRLADLAQQRGAGDIRSNPSLLMSALIDPEIKRQVAMNQAYAASWYDFYASGPSLSPIATRMAALQSRIDEVRQSEGLGADSHVIVTDSGFGVLDSGCPGNSTATRTGKQCIHAESAAVAKDPALAARSNAMAELVPLMADKESAIVAGTIIGATVFAPGMSAAGAGVSLARSGTQRELASEGSALTASTGSRAEAGALARAETRAVQEDAPAVVRSFETRAAADGVRGGASKGGTYKLRDPEAGQVRRTGRTNDLDRRRGEHGRHPETRDLDFEVDRRTDSYPAQRGREQRIHDEHPEADLNRKRPIDPRNPRRDEYLREGDKL